MRAWQAAAPWGLDALTLIEQPDPKPGHGQVLVRMRAVSLNYRDLMMVGGVPGGKSAATGPIIPFSDGCGVVEAVGEGVTRVAVGDRVATMFYQDWVSGPPTRAKQASALAGAMPGVGRELAVLSQDGVSRVPDFLTDEEVSTLPCAALTAWRALFVDARLEPGAMVVLQGTGGVSIFGLQFARAAGFRTLITSSSDEKLARAAELGADHLVNYRTTPAWSAAVREATGDEGADFVMEVGGPGTLQESLKAIRVGGHVALIGVLTSHLPGAGALTFSGALMVTTCVRMQGVMVGSRDMFEAMCRAIAQTGIRPVIDKVYPWTEAPAAFAALRDGEHFGKIVLKF